MRHAKAFRKFSRTPAHRRAMLRNMTTSLFLNESIETTVHKAKDLRRVAEKLITVAGNDSLASRRKAYSYLTNKAVVHKLFAEIGPRFKSRPGGYTRIVRIRTRAGDAAELASLQLITEEYSGSASGKKKAGGGKDAGAAGDRKEALPAEAIQAQPEASEESPDDKSSDSPDAGSEESDKS